MAQAVLAERERNHYGLWLLPAGSRWKPRGSCYSSTALCSPSAPSLDERNEAMSISRHFLIHIPTMPYGKMEFLPYNLSGAVRRHFLSNYGSCIMNDCTESPSAAKLTCLLSSLFHLNAILTRKWATFSFPLHFAISNRKNHTT